MFSKDLEKLIQQHGEAARLYENEAIEIGDIYIIPNFGFDPTVQSTLESLVGHRRSWRHGVVDIRVFAKPKDCKLFDSDEVFSSVIFFLFSLHNYLISNFNQNCRVRYGYA